MSRFRVDGLTDGLKDGRTNKGDYYGPHWVNPGSKKRETRKNHSLFEQFECVHCVRVLPTKEDQMHQIRQKDLKQCNSIITFKHPFTMIAAGPTRSGKTTYTIQNFMVLHAVETYVHQPEKVNA